MAESTGAELKPNSGEFSREAPDADLDTGLAAGPAGLASDTDKAAPARRAGDVLALRRDDFDRDVWCLLGIPVDVADINRAVAEIDTATRGGKRLSFVTPNVNWLVRALKSGAARREILEADLSLIDGAPLVALARALGVPVTSRVAGSDIFEALRRRPDFSGRRLRVFFFGGRDGAAQKAAETLNRERGGVEAVGWHNPGFGDLDSMSETAITKKINAANPDFVVVALGAGKGQSWIDRNQAALSAPVLAHLGAVVDFTSGGIRRAPALVQKLGFEWAWRIKEEPSLWRRYFDDALALSSIIVTRLVPQLFRATPKTKAGEAAARLIFAGPIATIELSGDLTHPSLKSVREAFRAAAGRGTDVRLNFSEVGSFDRSFLGLLLMLEKHVGRASCRLFVDGASSAQRAVLNMNQMQYPESDAAAALEGVVSKQPQAAI